MVHIGIDARLTYYRDGGISTYTRQLINALQQLDEHNQYTVFHSRKDDRRISKQFARAALWTPAHHRIERLALSVELVWRGLDVFHSPDFIPPYRAAKHHIITVHDLTFLHYPEYLTADSRAYYNDQIEAACHHADHILAVSEATKNDIVEMLKIDAAKITVQPHGVNPQYRPMTSDETEPIQQALNLPSEYILHVGTLEPRKNIIGLLKAYQLLLNQLPDAPPMLLVGRKGWLFEQTHAAMDKLNLGDKLIWRDDVTDAQLPAIYNMASVLVSPSFYEGFGMPALEAMACGTIPIVSNRSSLPEVVGDVGLLINPDDPSDIANAMHHALTDSAWRDAMQTQAIARAEHFTWERSAQIALKTYTASR